MTARTGPLHCVVDASVAIKAFVPEEDTEKAVEVLSHLTRRESRLHVPELFYAEMANILWKSAVRGRHTQTDAEHDVADLGRLGFATHKLKPLMPVAMAMSFAHGISVYDGCYVALADRLSLPLITADEVLARKVKGATDIRFLRDLT